MIQIHVWPVWCGEWEDIVKGWMIETTRLDPVQSHGAPISAKLAGETSKLNTTKFTMFQSGIHLRNDSQSLGKAARALGGREAPWHRTGGPIDELAALWGTSILVTLNDYHTGVV